ncbi:unnamed protein product [Moneuplotes crassus]|uniref:Uncharacterized protein n=1 Tax=Euplotes crassus TaxID=5936 RepID=A0AAD1X8I0_EUPCR|nr:unnamed protein product [Moneuplotes crassus]
MNYDSSLAKESHITKTTQTIEAVIPNVSSKPRILNVDQMLEEAGGFGNWSLVVFLYGSISSLGLTIYFASLPFLELVPRLECKQGSQWIECTKQDICHNGELADESLWRVDYTDQFSFRNWMTELQLYCYSDFWIGLFGSLCILGVALNGVILKQADHFGRRKMLIFTCIAQTMSCLVLFYTTSIYVIYVVLFSEGLLFSKNYLVYIYCVEVICSKHQVFYGAIVLAMEATIPKVLNVAYLYFCNPETRDLCNFCIYGAVTALIALCFSLVIPESPRYLYEKKMWKELREAISFIASFNKVEMDEAYLIDEQEKDNSDSQRLLLATHEKSNIQDQAL